MSSAIRHIHYKPDREELSIWFAANGRRYKYFGVPQLFYDAMRDAPSRGAFFNHYIKGRFACQLADVSDKQLRRWQAIKSAS
ncbi:KTSC domain-containing protein [uncultured Devosia sp.]|uniref:KTSC domain-containing protein n=1 Tax=uncultured Devosia sp. TaxID=211434 RepID=UPI0035CB33B6